MTVADRTKKCGGCKYWEVLGKHPLSDGVCRWGEINRPPPMPFWMRPNMTYGAISKHHTGCKVHDEKS